MKGRKVLVAVSAALLFVFAGCSNMFATLKTVDASSSDTSSEDDTSSVTGVLISFSNVKDSSSRSAYPTVSFNGSDEGSVTSFYGALAANGQTPGTLSKMTQSGSSYLLSFNSTALASGSYTLSVYGFKKGETNCRADNAAVSGTAVLSITADKLGYATTVTLGVNRSNTEKGSINLALTDNSNKIKAVQAELKNTANPSDTSTLTCAVSGGRITLTGTNVSSGTYSLQLLCYGDNEKKKLIYTLPQEVNVWPGCKTNKWYAGNGTEDTLGIKTADIFTTYYVRGEKDSGECFYAKAGRENWTANSNNSGGLTDPLDSVQTAVERLEAAGASSGTIYIDGVVTATAEANTTCKSAIYVSSTTNITIASMTAHNATILAQSDAEYTGADRKERRGIYKSGGATLTLKNITIKNGYSNGYTGGGIFCSGGTVSLSGCVVTGNTAGTGGGISVSSGTLLFPTGNKVYENRNTTSALGAGIDIGFGANFYSSGTTSVSGDSPILDFVYGNTYTNTAGTETAMGDVYEGKQKYIRITNPDTTESKASVNTASIKAACTGAQAEGTIFLGKAGAAADTTWNVTNVNVSNDKSFTIQSSSSSCHAILTGDGKTSVCTFSGSSSLSLTRIDVTNGGTVNKVMCGGGIYKSGSGPLTLTSCNIYANKVDKEYVSTETLNRSYGGGIYKEGTGMLTLNACSVYDNQAQYADSLTPTNKALGWGGGIYVKEGDLSLINGTVIGRIKKQDGSTITTHATATDCSNKAYTGGGIYFAEGNYTMTTDNSTVISYNYATQDGGGVYDTRAYKTSCDVKGAITYNAAGCDGGGLNIKGSFLAISGTIKGNYAGYDGGGIRFYESTSTVSGQVENNSCGREGGGLNLFYNSTVTLTGTVTGNNAGTGGGVYVRQFGNTFTMNGAACVAPASGNEVYLDVNQCIHVSSPLTSTGVVARIVPSSYAITTQVLDTAAVTYKSKFTIVPKESKNWYIGIDGKIFSNENSTAATTAELNSIAETAKNYTDLTFTVTLSQNIDDLETVTIPQGAKIVLTASSAVNINCLSQGNNYRHFDVEQGATLTLSGSLSGSLTMTGADYVNNAQYAVYVESGGTLILNSGVKITGFFENGSGCVFISGSCEINDGVTISGNKARYGGGIYISSGGSVTMNGGSITDNYAVNGGKAVAVDGTFIWSGGTISNNTGGEGVEVIYVGSGATFTNNSGNTAS